MRRQNNRFKLEIILLPTRFRHDNRNHTQVYAWCNRARLRRHRLALRRHRGARRRDRQRHHRLAERRAVLGPEPALHAGRAADLQAGVRPAARPEPKLELDPELITEMGARGRRHEHGGRAARRRHVPQRRQDDRGGFPLHLLRAHQGRPQGRHRQFLAQGHRHRDRLAHQGGDEVRLAGADRAAMARLPRQLHGAEGLYGEGRRRRVPREAGRHRALQAGRISAEFPHRARAQRRLLGRRSRRCKRVTFEIIKDPSARVAAMQSGQVDLTINVPVREVQRLQSEPNLAGEINPITRVILLQVRNDLGFADQNVRLAAHHAIDKEALSKAFYGGAAVPLSVPATPGTAGLSRRLQFDYSPGKAKRRWRSPALGRRSRRRSNSAPPTATSRATTTSRARIVQMWKRVGIEAELETIEYAKYFELNRGDKLPEATLYSWDNATGDPEIFAGYLLNPKMPFSAWKGMDVGAEGDRAVQHRRLQQAHRGLQDAEQGRGRGRRHDPAAAERAHGGAQEEPDYAKYGNGWILADTMDWSVSVQPQHDAPEQLARAPRGEDPAVRLSLACPVRAHRAAEALVLRPRLSDSSSRSRSLLVVSAAGVLRAAPAAGRSGRDVAAAQRDARGDRGEAPRDGPRPAAAGNT